MKFVFAKFENASGCIGILVFYSYSHIYYKDIYRYSKSRRESCRQSLITHRVFFLKCNSPYFHRNHRRYSTRVFPRLDQ